MASAPLSMESRGASSHDKAHGVSLSEGDTTSRRCAQPRCLTGHPATPSSSLPSTARFLLGRLERAWEGWEEREVQGIVRLHWGSFLKVL